jgi:purine-nucleoside phosphorylase
MYNRVMESVNYIESKVSTNPEVAVTIGSGLGNLIDILEDKQ